MTKYDKSFKEEVIRLTTTSSQPISKTSRDLGIKESSLYNWISQAKNDAPIVSDEHGNKASLIEKLNRLRKENIRLKEEREILKMATALFAKETK